MAASERTNVVQFRAAKKTRPAKSRRHFDPDAVHKRILAQAETLASQYGRPEQDRFPDLVDLVKSALSDARSRRNRRRPMIHLYRGKNYRMAVVGFDRLVLYDYATRRKLASTECFAL